jgi:hypothetical protein
MTQALRDRAAASDTQLGPVFREIDRWGNVEHHCSEANSTVATGLFRDFRLRDQASTRIVLADPEAIHDRIGLQEARCRAPYLIPTSNRPSGC